jgi:hypothetical protein
MVRNVHREPVHAYVDYGDLTEECKAQLSARAADDLGVITDEEGIEIIDGMFTIQPLL